MNQSEQESPGVGAHDFFLPGRQLDAPRVVPAATVLWEQAGPVFPVGANHHASLGGLAADATTVGYCADGPRALVDDPGVSSIEAYPQSEYPASVLRQAAVTEIEPEEVRVLGSVQGLRAADGT
jgi:hypothetical protein